jgi:hypothetical protein
MRIDPQTIQSHASNDVDESEVFSGLENRVVPDEGRVDIEVGGSSCAEEVVGEVTIPTPRASAPLPVGLLPINIPAPSTSRCTSPLSHLSSAVRTAPPFTPSTQPKPPDPPPHPKGRPQTRTTEVTMDISILKTISARQRKRKSRKNIRKLGKRIEKKVKETIKQRKDKNKGYNKKYRLKKKGEENEEEKKKDWLDRAKIKIVNNVEFNLKKDMAPGTLTKPDMAKRRILAEAAMNGPEQVTRKELNEVLGLGHNLFARIRHQDQDTNAISQALHREKRSDALSEETKKVVNDFYLSNSRPTTNKRDIMTWKKRDGGDGQTKHQKHIVTQYFRRLHAQFCQEHSANKICFATFLKLRPFFVVKATGAFQNQARDKTENTSSCVRGYTVSSGLRCQG